MAPYLMRSTFITTFNHNVTNEPRAPLLKYRAFNTDFLRATLCVSAALAFGRCPSVRPSHSFIVFKRLKMSWNFFLNQLAPSFYFWAKLHYTIPSHTLQRERGFRKIRNFRLMSCYILETAQDRPVTAMERYSKFHVPDWSLWVPMTLSDLERQNARRTVFFLADLHMYARTVWPTAIKFGMIIHLGRTSL